MATCYIFAQYFDDENALSLRLNDLGQVDSPLERRTIDELRRLQTHARTIIVLPAAWCSLHELELPWLGERKMREAIPYALEDEVADNVTALHFAFERPSPSNPVIPAQAGTHLQRDSKVNVKIGSRLRGNDTSLNDNNSKLLVVVINKQILIDLKERLLALNLTYDVITLDWFALKSSEVCVGETGLLISASDFKGVLGLELSSLYLQKLTDHTPLLIFKDSPPIVHDGGITRMDCSLYVWIAERLDKSNALNLCQGEFKHNVRQEMSQRWYQISAVLVLVWLVSLLLTSAFEIQKLNHKLAVVNQQTASIYHEFFPQAQQIISPRFRIGEWLKNNVSHSNSAMWQLLDKLARVFKQKQFTVEQMHFQNQALTIIVSCPNFAALEQMQSQLQQAGVQVKQMDAATHAKTVVATLALTL